MLIEILLDEAAQLWVTRPQCFGKGSLQPCDNAVARLNHLTAAERAAWTGKLKCDICGDSWYGVTFGDGYVVWQRISAQKVEINGEQAG
jgi:hypothetical protein